MQTDLQAFDAARDAIRAMEQEIVAEVGQSDMGRSATAQANVEGPTRISAIILVDARFTAHGAIAFKAHLELSDEAHHLYEAEVEGLFERRGDGSGLWQKSHFDVLDATPVPMGG